MDTLLSQSSPFVSSPRRSYLPLALALIVSAVILGAFYYQAQSVNRKDILSVTGSTKTAVTSDQAKLSVSIARQVPLSQLASGYTAVARDLALTKALLTREGIPASGVFESPVSMNQFYDGTNTPGAETKYELRQTVTVQSNDVKRLTDISKKIPSLTSEGALVSIQSLEYYYSKLADLRVSLLSDAIKDAKARAAKIAEGTGREIGAVQSASNGVVQLLQPNSVEISDYGSYDTSSIEKEVMVTLKASFYLK